MKKYVRAVDVLALVTVKIVKNAQLAVKIKLPNLKFWKFIVGFSKY